MRKTGQEQSFTNAATASLKRPLLAPVPDQWWSWDSRTIGVVNDATRNAGARDGSGLKPNSGLAKCKTLLLSIARGVRSHYGW